MKKIVVFDFDKTLTMHDTLLNFFCFNEKKTPLFISKFCLYFLCMILAKFNVIHNTTLKKIGVCLFLKHADLKRLNYKLQHYGKSNHVKYSKLYKELQFNNNTKYYVVSGSFEDYIKPLFPNSVCVIGSRLTQDHGDRTILGFNCYGEGKLMALSNLGVDHIDVFYTDSYDDLPLVKISKNTIVVSGDDLIRCNHVHEFIDYFKR